MTFTLDIRGFDLEAKLDHRPPKMSGILNSRLQIGSMPVCLEEMAKALPSNHLLDNPDLGCRLHGSLSSIDPGTTIYSNFLKHPYFCGPSPFQKRHLPFPKMRHVAVVLRTHLRAPGWFVCHSFFGKLYVLFRNLEAASSFL